MYGVPGPVFDPHTAEYIAEQVATPVMYRYDDCTHLFRVEKLNQFYDDLDDFMSKY